MALHSGLAQLAFSQQMTAAGLVHLQDYFWLAGPHERAFVRQVSTAAVGRLSPAKASQILRKESRAGNPCDVPLCLATLGPRAMTPTTPRGADTGGVPGAPADSGLALATLAEDVDHARRLLGFDRVSGVAPVAPSAQNAIGLLAPMTGKRARVGAAMLRAALLALSAPGESVQNGLAIDPVDDPANDRDK